MSTLKHSAAEWCYFRKEYESDPAGVYRRLKSAGFGALEMVAESRWEIARGEGLRLLNTTAPGMQDGLNRVENHATILPAIRERLAKARKLGIGQIIVFSGSRKGQDDAQGIRNCTAALKQVAGEAEDGGVTLLLEVLNAYDHADYQCDNSRYAFEVIDAVASPRVKVLYDIYHMHRMGEDVGNVITKNVARIGHLHVAGSPKRDFPGADQSIDYRSLVQQVMAAGYDGYWGQEFRCESDAVGEMSKACALFESYAG